MPNETEPQRIMDDYWWIPVVIGGLTLAAAVFVIAYPDISLNALAIVIGFNMILIGAGALLSTIGNDKDDSTLLVVVAVLTVLAGIIVARRPEGAVLLVTLSIGIWLVLAGVVDLVQAISAKSRRGAHAIVGILKLVMGVVIVSVPDQSVATLAVLAGIGLAISGLGGILTGLAMRSASAQADRQGAPAPIA